MDDPDSLSTLQYARLHGLALDHRSIDPLDFLPDLLDSELSISDCNIHTTSPLSFGAAEKQAIDARIQREKLEVGKDAASFLSSVLAEMSSAHIDERAEEWIASFPKHPTSKEMKVACPLLTTEEEMYMHTFGRKNRRNFANDILDGAVCEFDQEATANANDEGLEFPNWFWELPDVLEEKIRQEKLDCSRGALQFLQKARLPDQHEAHERVMMAAGDWKWPRRPLSPLYLENETQFTRSMTPEPEEHQDIASTRTETEPALDPDYGKESDMALKYREVVQSPGGNLDGRLEYSADVGFVRDLSANTHMEPTCYHACPPAPQSVQEIAHDALALVDKPYDPTNDVDNNQLHHPVSNPLRAVNNITKSTHSENTSHFMDENSWILEASSPSETQGKGGCAPEEPDLQCMDGPAIQSSPYFTTRPRSSSPAMIGRSKPSPSSCLSNARDLNSDGTKGESGVDSRAHAKASFNSPIEINLDSNRIKPLLKGFLNDSSLQKQTSVDENVTDFGIHGSVEQEATSRATVVTPNASTRSILHKLPRSTSERPSKSCLTVQPSLGTLESFLQTRGRDPKRRKLDEKSPYFGNATPSLGQEATEVTESIAVGGNNTEMTTDESQLRSDAWTANILPRCLAPTTSFLLILSASLLQTDRHLIRSLETYSPAPRLIFRDYNIKSPRTNGSPVTDEEADVTVSPQTGIILTTSQETTQVHLPGHGDNVRTTFFKSPLQERIARISERYENIYVLVRVPTIAGAKIPVIDAGTMSSILSLHVFCVSLARIVTPLLIPSSENVLMAWICSIASHHGICSGNEEDVAWSSYLDEETQWEIFLRHAGLNAFAAQSVLGALKSVGGRKGGDGVTMPGLSLFIEMDPAERRALFTGLVGERLLNRAENILEQQWQ